MREYHLHADLRSRKVTGADRRTSKVTGQVDSGVEAGCNLIESRLDVSVARRDAAGVENVNAHRVGSKHRTQLEFARRDVGILPFGLGWHFDLEHDISEVLLGLLGLLFFALVILVLHLVGRTRRVRGTRVRTTRRVCRRADFAVPYKCDARASERRRHLDTLIRPLERGSDL